MGPRGKITAWPFVLLAYPARVRVYGVRVCGIVEEIQSTESADLTGDFNRGKTATGCICHNIHYRRIKWLCQVIEKHI